MKNKPIAVFRYPPFWRVKMLIPICTAVPLFTFTMIYNRMETDLFQWFLILLSYCASLVAMVMVADTIVYPDKIVGSIFGIHFVTIRIVSIHEIRKTMVSEIFQRNYCEEISIRKRGAPKKDGLSGIFNTIRVTRELVRMQEFKKCLMDISAENNIPMTFVDPRLPPVGRGPEAFDPPLRVSEL